MSKMTTMCIFFYNISCPTVNHDLVVAEEFVFLQQWVKAWSCHKSWSKRPLIHAAVIFSYEIQNFLKKRYSPLSLWQRQKKEQGNAVGEESTRSTAIPTHTQTSANYSRDLALLPGFQQGEHWGWWINNLWKSNPFLATDGQGLAEVLQKSVAWKGTAASSWDFKTPVPSAHLLLLRKVWAQQPNSRAESYILVQLNKLKSKNISWYNKESLKTVVF